MIEDKTNKVCDPKAGFGEPIQTTEEPISKHSFTMKLNGLAEETIKTSVRKLKQVAKQCNITNPYEVKEFLSEVKWKNSTKHRFVGIYNSFLTTIGKTWKPPKYKKETTTPFIPTKEEIDQLIASTQRLSTTASIMLMHETGARIGEIEKITWNDLDTARKTITIAQAEKGSNPRTIPITEKLINILNQLPRNHKTILGIKKHSIASAFYRVQERAILKMQNPRLKEIHPHTFRHYKGTMTYYKTRDIMFTKYILGHKSVESTQIYINIAEHLYATQPDDYKSAIAKTIEEAQKLIELGFEYITEMDNIKLFRKRK